MALALLAEVVVGRVTAVEWREAIVAKLSGPSSGQKRVQVNDPSRFGRAIIMKSPRGQMCRACFSSGNAPPGTSGRAATS